MNKAVQKSKWFLSILLNLVMLLTLVSVFPVPVFAVLGGYNPGDIEVINDIIVNNGLNWIPYTDPMYEENPSWYQVIWSNVPTDRRITGLKITDLDGATGVTGVLDVSALTNLATFSCDNTQLTAIDAHGLVNLTTLHLYNNKIIELDVSGLSNLVSFLCTWNQLEKLDASDLASLPELDCSYNQLTELKVNNLTNLLKLNCSVNQLDLLDVSDLTNLRILSCDANKLVSLDVSNLTKLENLSCGGNKLTSLDLSNLTSLKFLGCGKNPLMTLDMSNQGSLTALDCHENQLAALDVSALISLESLNCRSNQLTELDASTLKNLSNLYCDWNQIETLRVSGLEQLTILSCSDNDLVMLDVRDLTKLSTLYCYKNQLTALDVSSLEELRLLRCYQNQLTTLDISNLTILEELSCSNNLLTGIKLNSSSPYNIIDVTHNHLADESAVTGVQITWGVGTFFFDPQDQTTDTTAPLVASVTPSGAGAAINGYVEITFNEVMDVGVSGTVQFNDLSPLHGGTWSKGSTLLTIPYANLSSGASHTVNLSGFADLAGNVMIADSSHSFITTEIPSATYNVTVNGGTGGGFYESGDTINISADTPPAGQQFANWTSVPFVVFTDTDSTSASFIMPAANVSVTANFKAIPQPTHDYAIGVDNYRFSNTWSSFGYPMDYRVPVERFQELFGPSLGQQYYDIYGVWNGACFGFTSTDLAFFNHLIPIMSYQVDAATIFDLDPPGIPMHPLTRLIELFQFSQLESNIQAKFFYWSRDNAQGLVDAVRSFCSGNSEDAVILGLTQPGVGAHALVPFDVKYLGNDEYELSIYDCNYPTDTGRKMYLNTTSGVWKYIIYSPPPYVLGGVEKVYSQNNGGYFGYIKYKDVFDVVNSVAQINGQQNENSTLQICEPGDMKIAVTNGADLADANGIPIESVLGAYETTPMGVVIMDDGEIPAPLKRFYTTSEGLYRTVLTGGGEAVFLNNEVLLSASIGGDGSISGSLGANQKDDYVIIKLVGEGGFGVEYGNTSTAKNPLVLSATGHGEFSVTADGNDLSVTSVAGDAAITATANGRSQSYVVKNGQTAIIAYLDPGSNNNSGNGSSAGGGVSSGSSSANISATAITEINKAADGGTVKITLGTDTLLMKAVFEALASKNITLEISTGGFVWSINGKDVTKTGLKDVNMGASVGTAAIPATVTNLLTGEKGNVVLSLRHEGSFGFTMTLQANLGSANAGYFANLYYYNKAENRMEFRSVAKIATDGMVALKFAGASDYAIVIDAKAHKTAWIRLVVGSMAYTVNSETKAFDVAPVITDGRAMIPLRFIAEALGAKVVWNGDTSTATVELDGKTLSVTIGKTTPGMDVPAVIMNERTMIPLRYVSENLGCEVVWTPDAQTIDITK